MKQCLICVAETITLREITKTSLYELGHAEQIIIILIIINYE